MALPAWDTLADPHLGGSRQLPREQPRSCSSAAVAQGMARQAGAASCVPAVRACAASQLEPGQQQQQQHGMEQRWQSMAELPMGMWFIQLAENAPVPANGQVAACLTESGIKFGLFCFKNIFFFFFLRTTPLGKQWYTDIKEYAPMTGIIIMLLKTQKEGVKKKLL